MIRKDFITVEGCFRDEPMMTEVPTKAEYDDFRQRVAAVFERIDKEVHELEDRIKALETKKNATESTSKSTVKVDETFIEDEVTLRLRFPKKWNTMTKGDIQEILNKYIEYEWRKPTGLKILDDTLWGMIDSTVWEVPMRCEGLKLYSTLKVHKLTRLYKETGNELYYVLAKYYLGESESPELLEWFINEISEKRGSKK